VRVMADRLLKKSEARDALRVGPRKLDELIKSRELDVIRLGSRTVRISEQAVRDLVERRTDGRGQ
jgi:excisionase family DNA binding protein